MSKTTTKRELSPKQQQALLATLEIRFAKNEKRHKGIVWANVAARLRADAAKLWSLNEMERTGGEPDVIGLEKKTGAYVFCDCSAESPAGRRNACYDHEAQVSRKEHQPKNNAIDLAEAMGISLLNEADYRTLQKIGNFDEKTSSWIETPPAIRKLGGALFCDRRYDNVFIYHNGAQSYYAARGFRGKIAI